MHIRHSDIGASLLELIFVTGLLAVITAVAVPPMLAALDDLRTLGAVRYISSRLQQARTQAVTRSTDAAVRFTPDGPSYAYAVFLDGNRNGVRSTDIQSGIDREIHRGERLADQFPGIEFGTLPSLPSVDPSAPAPGADPIRLGSSDMVSFSALGTSTPGSLYVLGPGGAQYVVRIFGGTGKTRILRFDARGRRWIPL
jgi:type II secretory pathway pseudopilin PulG